MAEPSFVMRRAHVVVEGHGEVNAAGNLLTRISQRLELPIRWAPPRRGKIHGGIDMLVKTAMAYRHEPKCDALLLLRDEDDRCPREEAPVASARLRELALPFPIAFVMLHREYEVIFLPCLGRMSGARLDGRPSLLPGSTWSGPWEAKRGIKEKLSAMMPQGQSYKPSVDQLAFTQMIDLDELAAAAVPCFGTLERAVAFLSSAGPGETYPP
jgi:hypothetical protein